MNRVAQLFRLVLVSLAIGCTSGGDVEESASLDPLPLDGTECEACGMTVEEQPSPRGQVIHRDGTHAFFCSLADMATYLESPSPHGSAIGQFVEVMPADVEPADTDFEQRPWVDARVASFVVGDFERPVMGRPILSFDSDTDAAGVSTRLSGQMVEWDSISEHIH